MMNFERFAHKLNARFQVLQTGDKPLFRSVVTGDELWATYLKSFRPGDDPIFRDPKSTEHTCNLDKAIIRRYGNIVSINQDHRLETIFDVEIDETSIYYQPAKAMSELLKSHAIENLFVETFAELTILPYERCTKQQQQFRVGFPVTHKQYSQEEVAKYGGVTTAQIYTFPHFYLDIQKEYVSMTKDSIASLQADYKQSKEVLQRGFQEIKLPTLQLVRDLILQNSILDGTSHLKKVEKMIALTLAYNTVSVKNPLLRDNFVWLATYKNQYARFRSELVGTLCADIESGMSLDVACKTWNKRVDPANYQKATAPITQSQIEKAKEFVQEAGYEESFARRFATIADISIEEIAHISDSKSEIKTASIFDGVKATQAKKVDLKTDTIEEVSIEKFMKDILPHSASVEALVETRMQGNFVALTTTLHPAAKLPFKWNNPFSYTFNGNLAGKSLITSAVKKAGGKVDGPLRFSISWNEDGRDIVDLDAHAQEPSGGRHIDFSIKGQMTALSGMLDVDMIRPNGIGVENIVWSDLARMKDGKYILSIVNYDNARHKGSKAEIEMNGELYEYTIPTIINTSKDRFADHAEQVVAEVTLSKGNFTIKHIIQPSAQSSVNVWNIDTQQFHKVNLVCLTPNHWGDNNVGNKHYLFMLENCKSDAPLRSFHVENLNADLLQHRKVMEVLGLTTQLQPAAEQLAGLGFNATMKDELVVKVSGTHNRMLKIKF